MIPAVRICDRQICLVHAYQTTYEEPTPITARTVEERRDRKDTETHQPWQIYTETSACKSNNSSYGLYGWIYLVSFFIIWIIYIATSLITHLIELLLLFYIQTTNIDCSTHYGLILYPLLMHYELDLTTRYTTGLKHYDTPIRLPYIYI